VEAGLLITFKHDHPFINRLYSIHESSEYEPTFFSTRAQIRVFEVSSAANCVVNGIHDELISKSRNSRV
jgi:hypothetical protein